MNKNIQEAISLVREMLPELQRIKGVEKVIFPPFVALSAVAEVLSPTDIMLGAQNMHWEEKGAYTGEISPLMLKGLCQYVILGHSERRGYFGETDEIVNKKIKAAFAHKLIPIACVGESLEQHEEGKTEEVVSAQVRGVLAGLPEEQVRKLVIAYEPIWAIGTGKPATGKGANSVIGTVVRGTIAEIYGEEVALSVRIQYGGSVSPKNIAEFMAQPEIDGALVGGASLRAKEFVEIVRISARLKGVGEGAISSSKRKPTKLQS
jgi:triosephosphate isomerase